MVLKAEYKKFRYFICISTIVFGDVRSYLSPTWYFWCISTSNVCIWYETFSLTLHFNKVVWCAYILAEIGYFCLGGLFILAKIMWTCSHAAGSLNLFICCRFFLSPFLPFVVVFSKWLKDSYFIGCLIYELFSGMSLSKTEELRNTASIPKVGLLRSWFLFSNLV